MISKSQLRRLTIEQLKQALHWKERLDQIEVLERQRSALLKSVATVDTQIARLKVTPTLPSGKPKRKSWKLSTETRRKMSEAAKRRYATQGNAAKAESTAPEARKKSRTISAARRAAISAAQKARWAKMKATAAGN
jgi:hypothetical protein